MSTEVTEGTEALEKLLSLEASPAGALTAEQRSALNEAFEGADTEESLRSLLTVAQAALRQRPDNLRAQYSVALYRELTGDTEEAARTYLRLGRELAGRGDWRGVRELAVRALGLHPENGAVRLLLEAWAHLEDKSGVEDDLTRAVELCPESPDLKWWESQRADEQGRQQEAEDLAFDALSGYITEKEPDRAEGPLLRILAGDTPEAYRRLLRIIPRMATAGLADLLVTTLDLAEAGFAKHGLWGPLAATLERMLLTRKGLEVLRPRYVSALTQSLGGSESILAFVRDCGLADPNVPLEQALERFHAMFDFRPGAYVEHSSLGVGRIVAHEGAFLVIDFAEKPGHRMGLEIAARSLRPLPESCLRVARFAEPDTIAREIASDPVAILVRALTDLGGQATARDLRDCLCGSTIPEPDWSAWWKRAREAAQSDPRVDTSQAFRQVYRLAGAGDEDEVELPPLPTKGGAHSAALLIERFLRQHPELEDRARAAYAEELAARALAGHHGEGITAVPLLLRWMPERADQWTAVAEAAFQRGQGVSAGISAEQQAQLLELGLSGDLWREAALSGLASRFPAIRHRSLEELRARLGEQWPETLKEALMAKTIDPGIRLAIVRLALSGALGEGAPSPWELLVAAVSLLATDPVPKLREQIAELLDPQERLAAMLRRDPPNQHIQEQLRQVARELAASESGLEVLVLLLQEVGSSELLESLQIGTQVDPDPIEIHFDPKVTLMTRATYESNLAKIRELQHQLSNVIPREIAAARSLGDLAENAEYHAARERQGIVAATLRSLQAQMEGARVIEDLVFPEDLSAVGTEVTVRDLDRGDEHTYWILGHGDSVQDSHVINYRAPLGQALVGKRVGDVVSVETNGATHRLQILAVRRRLP